MEITMQNIRTGVVALAVAVTVGSILYSCSSQVGLAQKPSKVKISKSSPVVKDTVKPIEVKETLKSVIAENKALQKTLSPLRKQLEQELPDMLIRSRKAFGEISDIKGMLDYMNSNSIAERDFFMKKAIEIRSSNDSLTGLVIGLKTDNINYMKILMSIEQSRKKVDEERKVADLESKVRDDINDKIMKYGLITVIFFSILTFCVSLWTRRHLKLTSHT